MVSEIKKKEILTVKEMLDSYNESIKTAIEGLDKITEKYKKLMEEEKKSLKETLADSKSAVKMWEKMFNAFSPEAVKEVLGEGYGEPEFDGAGFTSEDNETQTEGEPADDEVVVDGLFSEENMNQDDDQPETEDAETEDVGTEEVQADMSIDEMVEEAETAVEEMKAYPKNDESSDDDDDDWAPVPDDWV